MFGTKIKDRFRQFLPVVVDVETGGLEARKHALIEVCAIPLVMQADGMLALGDIWSYAIKPERSLMVEQSACDFLGYDPYSALRFAEPECTALKDMNMRVKRFVKASDCTRAILVGHNAWFDLSFLNEGFKRQKISSAFHNFSTFDTATLGAALYGHTVLNQLCQRARIDWDKDASHSAEYDCKKTAELFCRIINQITAQSNS